MWAYFQLALLPTQRSIRQMRLKAEVRHMKIDCYDGRILLKNSY